MLQKGKEKKTKLMNKASGKRVMKKSNMISKYIQGKYVKGESKVKWHKQEAKCTEDK